MIPEVVDDNYRPVRPGKPGDRLLASVQFSRTIPLIRCEMTDRVRLATQRCPCALPFQLLDSIEGRTDDVLDVPTPGGGVLRVHPVVFHQALDLLDAAGWQVRQHEDQLRVLVAGPGPGFDPAGAERTVQAALTTAGAHASAVHLSVVDAIPTGAAGKRPLVVANPKSRDRATVQPPAAGSPDDAGHEIGSHPAGGDRLSWSGRRFRPGLGRCGEVESFE